MTGPAGVPSSHLTFTITVNSAMNTHFFSKLMLPGAFALAFGASFASRPATAQAAPPVPVQDGGNGLLKKFLEGLGSTLSEDQKKELDQALEKFQKQAEDESGQPRRFEWRSEGRSDDDNNNNRRSAPRARSQNQDNPRGESQPRRRGRVERSEADPFQQLREQLQRGLPEGLGLEQFFNDDFFGPLLKEMERLQQQGGRGLGQESSPSAPWFQRRRGEQNRANRYEKDSRRAMAEFRPVVEDARDSVVTLYGKDGQQLALATIVTADGHALTTASALGSGEGVEAEFSDGRVAGVSVLDTAKNYNIALLKLDAKNLKPIQWNLAPEVPVGTLLAAASPDEDPLAIGVVSVRPRNLDSSKKGFLGVGMDGVPEGVRISRVTPDSAADKAGLKENDIITALDGKPIRTPKDLTDYITSRKAEDEVHIGFLRDQEDKVAVATLKSRDDMFGAGPDGQRLTETEFKRIQRQSDQTARMGVRGSDVADGFPAAMQNDLNLSPNQCGGPAVDLDGKAVGLNIARAERTKTYAIPAADITQLLTTVHEGKLHQPQDLSDLKRDARQAREDIDTLRSKLKEAEERAQKAFEELEKRR